MNLDALLAMQNEDFRKAFGARLKALRLAKEEADRAAAAAAPPPVKAPAKRKLRAAVPA